MNKKLILIGACIVAGIIAVGLLLPGAMKKRDLDRLCTISKEMLPVIENNPADGIVKFAERTESELLSPDVKNVLQALKVASPDQKSALLQQGTAELGYPDWQCPEFLKIYGI